MLTVCMPETTILAALYALVIQDNSSIIIVTSYEVNEKCIFYRKHLYETETKSFLVFSE